MKNKILFHLAFATNLVFYLIVSYHILMENYVLAENLSLSGILMNTTLLLLYQMFPKELGNAVRKHLKSKK